MTDMSIVASIAYLVKDWKFVINNGFTTNDLPINANFVMLGNYLQSKFST